MTSTRRFVYVAQSMVDPNRYYCGLTSDVTERLTTHNSGGSRHTASLRPWRLVVALEFAAEAGAVAFEKYLKTGSGRAFAKRHFV
jgi:putative endonuclease